MDTTNGERRKPKTNATVNPNANASNLTNETLSQDLNDSTSFMTFDSSFESQTDHNTSTRVNSNPINVNVKLSDSSTSDTEEMIETERALFIKHFERTKPIKFPAQFKGLNG